MFFFFFFVSFALLYQDLNTIIQSLKKKKKLSSLPSFHNPTSHFYYPTLSITFLYFTAYSFFSLRFKINKLLFLLLGLLFFYQILDQIGLLLLILNRKAKIHVGIELICYWVYLRVSKFQFRGGQNKNFKNNIIFKKKKKSKSQGFT